MEELMKKLNAIPDAYFDFVMGIIAYAKRKPERLEKVLNFLDASDDVKSSDVVAFVMSQPDFYEDGQKPRFKEIAG